MTRCLTLILLIKRGKFLKGSELRRVGSYVKDFMTKTKRKFKVFWELVITEKKKITEKMLRKV